MDHIYHPVTCEISIVIIKINPFQIILVTMVPLLTIISRTVNPTFWQHISIVINTSFLLLTWNYLSHLLSQILKSLVLLFAEILIELTIVTKVSSTQLFSVTLQTTFKLLLLISHILQVWLSFIRPLWQYASSVLTFDCQKILVTRMTEYKKDIKIIFNKSQLSYLSH